MAEARPHGIALAIVVLFAVGMTAGTLFFLGFAVLMVYGIFVPQGDEPASARLLLIVGGISAFIASAFAMVAAALWRAIIGPRGHSHA
jgi:hypothetical protein